MPIFEYHCERCGHHLDVLQKASEPAPDPCPACGHAALRKSLSAPSFQLNGKGWRKPTVASQKAQKKPQRRIGHMLDSGAPHSHDEPPARDRRANQVQPPAPTGHTHGDGHGHSHHDHKH